MNARGRANRTATNKQIHTRRHARTAGTARDTQNNIPTSDFRRRSVITRRRDRSGTDIVTTAYCSVPRNRRRCRLCAGETAGETAISGGGPGQARRRSCTASLFIGGGAVHAPSYGFFSLCAQANFRWQMRPARTHTRRTRTRISDPTSCSACLQCRYHVHTPQDELFAQRERIPQRIYIERFRLFIYLDPIASCLFVSRLYTI